MTGADSVDGMVDSGDILLMHQRPGAPAGLTFFESLRFSKLSASIRSSRRCQLSNTRIGKLAGSDRDRLRKRLSCPFARFVGWGPSHGASDARNSSTYSWCASERATSNSEKEDPLTGRRRSDLYTPVFSLADRRSLRRCIDSRDLPQSARTNIGPLLLWSPKWS